MKSVYERLEHNAATLKVTVDGEQWTELLAKAKNKLAKELQVPGFRKGHVPGKIVDKYVTAEGVQYEAAEKIAQQALEFGLDENKEIKLVDRPTLDVESISNEACVLKFNLTVEPEVTLGDYKSVEYKLGKTTVTKKEVEEEISKLQKQHAEEVLKEEGTVVSGDIAVIDFEGFVDGVAFEGGKGTEYPLEIGSGSFIPGFEDQIIGMATGEEKDVNVTFPTEYTAELAGKDATFKVKVCGIKEKKLPEVNEEFVGELNIENVKTVEELNKHLKEQLKASKVATAEENATNALLDGLCEKCEVEIPEVMVNSEIEETFQNYAARLQQQGISMDMYFQFTGMTAESFKESLKDECEKKVRVRLVLAAIGKDLGISATEEEVEEEYQAMATQYGMNVEDVKKAVPATYLTEDVTMRKTLESLKKPAAKAAKEDAE